MAFVEAFVQLRTDRRQLRQDVEGGIRDAARGPAPRQAGEQAGREFSSNMSDKVERETRQRGPKFVASWAAIGGSSGKGFGERFNAALRPVRDALDRLSHRTVTPKVELQGQRLTMAQLGLINRGLDRIDGRHAVAHVAVRTSLIGKAAGLLGAAGAGIGGIVSGGLAGIGGAVPGIGGLLSNPYSAAAALAAALAALPFAAQAAAGGIVAALGAGLAILPIIGAAKTKAVGKSFDALKTQAGKDLAAIGTSFVPVLQSILRTARSVMGQLTPVFAGAAKIISGPFRVFTNTFLRALTQPAVKTSIRAVATAFGAILKALTPQLAGDIGALATGITRIANTIKRNPRAFANFISFLIRAAGFAFSMIAALTSAASYIEFHFVPAFKRAYAWLSNNFVRPLVRFFTSTIPTAFNIFRLYVRLTWDRIEISALRFVFRLTGIFGKLPGFLGAPFRKAHTIIGGELGKIAADAARTQQKINADWAKLHGKKVTVSLAFAQGRSTKPGGFLEFHARGGPVRGAGTGTSDSVPIMASRGEYVMKATSVAKYGPKMMDAINQGRFAGGGLVGAVGSFRGRFPPGSLIDHDFAVIQARINAAAIAWAKQHVSLGGAGAIVADAMRWLGKIPYVWGGTAVPGGADCSGFVSTIYGRHGIGAPRTSEAQGAWVRRGPPIPGGLAFYHSPAGGPDPGHVAIVRDGRSVISQGGGMGPKLQSLHYLPLLWTGIPPGGFPGAGGGGAFGGTVRENQLSSLWIGAGGPRGIAHLMAAIAMAESGGRANAIGPMTQFGQARGLWQILGQIVGGNLFNPLVNARNAVAKFRTQGLGAWEAYTNGSYRRFLSNGGKLTEDVLGVGKSGRSYMMHKGEEVTPEATIRQQIALLERLDKKLGQLIGVTASAPAGLADALNGTAAKAAHRSRHSVT